MSVEVCVEEAMIRSSYNMKKPSIKQPVKHAKLSTLHTGIFFVCFDNLDNLKFNKNNVCSLELVFPHPSTNV